MADCLLIINAQKGWINQHTTKTVDKIAKLIHEHVFTYIAASQFCNTVDSPFDRLMNWQGMWNSRDQVLDVRIRREHIDKIFVTHTYTCFTAEFEKFAQHIDRIYLAGIGTDTSIMASAYDLFDHNIDFTILADCCVSDEQDPAIAMMKRSFGEKRIQNSTIFEGKEYDRYTIFERKTHDRAQ